MLLWSDPIQGELFVEGRLSLPAKAFASWEQGGVFRMRFRRLRLVPLALLVTIGLVGSVNATNAFAWCNTYGQNGRGNANGNFFDGMTTTGTVGTVGGVYGSITRYNPYAYSQYSSIWIMEDNGSSYAQIGYVSYPGSPGNMKGFTEVNEPGVFDQYFYPMPSGNTINYSAYYGNTAGYITLYQNGSRVRSDPANFTPTEGQTYAEMHNQASQMFGGSIDHVSLSNMHVYYSGGWQNFNGSAGNSYWYYQNGLQSPTWDVIWDYACGQ
jgi:hypothetical protein